jgi:hypothetical protein
LVETRTGGGGEAGRTDSFSVTRSDEYSATASFTFSYATSGDPDLAGHDSTMFLVPALNIVFSKSLKVEYSPMSCIATGSEVSSWSLTSSNNFKVCLWHFLGVFQILIGLRLEKRE